LGVRSQDSPLKPGCSTLLIDLDGTISDPSLGISRCVNHALEMHGLVSVSAELVAKEIGPPLDEMFLKLVPELSISDVPSLVRYYRERYSDIGYSENTMYPHIAGVLGKLHGADMRLGICTSKRRDFAERILGLFGIDEFFSFVDGGDIGIKKQEQIASLIERRLIDSDAVMVGDRAVDVEAASTNGLRSIGVLWGFGSSDELCHASPTRIVETPNELYELVI